MTKPDKSALRVMVMAGGTGGHVFPALAVARELQARGAQIMWLGTRRGLESEVVPKAGLPITYVEVRGLRGNGLVGWLLAPFRIARALAAVIGVINGFKPSVVLGMGGFVTGPGGVAAWLLRIPLVIHEQNAIAGMTNKLLAPFATRVLEAFPATFHGGKVIHTGNPVRQDIIKTDAAMRNTVNLKGGDVTNLLVVGGSLGAKALNETVPASLQMMSGQRRFNVWHQTGKKLISQTEVIYREKGISSARVVAFIDDMAEAYHWADLVVCRAGALTIAELAAAGVASILVPYPHAVDDHQSANAKYLSEQGAAIVIPQSELTADRLTAQLLALDSNRIREMSAAAKALALPEATRIVADQCVAAANV